MSVYQLFEIKLNKYRKQGIEPNMSLQTALFNEAVMELGVQEATLEAYRELERDD